VLRHTLLWLLLWLVTATSSMASTVLTAADSRLRLSGALVTVLRDPLGHLRIEDVASAAFADRFQAVRDLTSFGYTRDVIWLRLDLQRDAAAPAEWWLEVSTTTINDLRLYSPTPAGFSVSQCGDRFAFSQRAIAYHRPVFAVALPDSQPRRFYLRLESDSSLSAELALWQPTALRDAGQIQILLLGGLMGMVLMSALISLIHWNNTRNPTLLHFSAFNLVILVFLPTQLGLTTQIALANLPWLADPLVPWTLALMIVATLLVFFKSLEIATQFPRLARLIRLAMVLCLLAALSREFDLYSQVGGPLLQILFAASLLTTGWISWQRWRQKHQGAGHIFIAHMVLFSSILTGRLMYLGLLPANELTQNTWALALLTFLLLIHTGIVVDASVARHHREAAHEEARVARELAQRELHLRREQSVFFSFVAHELRTPLGIILMGLKNFSRELNGQDERSQTRLQRLTRAAERMAALVERHLHLQRLASADFELQMQPMSPIQIGNSALVEVHEAYPQRHFQLHCADNLPSLVSMDQELVQLALGNLLGNAAKYSPTDQPVQLSISGDSELRFQVIDHGPGIALQEQTRLFDLYKRSPTVDGQAGFGIGLATARHVAALHRGSLSYTDAPGGGAIFTLSLPTTTPELSS